MRWLKKLYQFILKTPWPFWGGSVFMAAAFLLNNVAPFFVKWLTEAAQTQNFGWAGQLILIFGGLLLLSNFLENFGYFITDKNMVTTSTLISHSVLSHIHNLDFTYHTNKSSGKLISLMKRGDDAFFTFYDILNRQFLNLGLSFLVMFGAFTQLQFRYLGFSLGLIGLSFFVSFFLVKLNIVKRNLFNTADNNLTAARVDNLMNFDTVKYFAHEKFEQRRFLGLLQKWNQALQAYFFTFRYFDTILGNIINAALVGIMWLALIDLQHQTISLAEFLLVLTFAMTLFPKMMNFLFSLRELAKKYSDLRTYLALLDEPILVIDPIQPVVINQPCQKLEFHDVTFAYSQNDAPVLKNFNLKINQGEAVALVGYSGAGKTTIAKLLMRMYDPTAGKITINDVALNRLTKAALRLKVGIVPQDPLLFNNTIFYNIAYARIGATETEVLAAAKAARVSDFVTKLPLGYQTEVGERGIKLSGGQRQRLAIARVLLEQPEILIFDEATSALDSVSEQDIQAAFWQLVRDPVQSRTAIIIAHRLSTIMKADKIVVMDKGKIVAMGTHAELMNQKNGIYYQLWSLQKNGFIGDGETEETEEN